MSDDDLRAALMAELGRVRAGMLGVAGHPFRPMTHHLDEDMGALWFITTKDSDWIAEAGGGHPATYCLIGKDHDLHATVTGTLAMRQDRSKLDEIWSPVAGAWFPDGKDDPSIALLCLSMAQAEVWRSTDSGIVFGLQVLRATLTGTPPDMGDHGVVPLDGPRGI